MKKLNIILEIDTKSLMAYCYEKPKKKIISYIFEWLVCNLKIYNGVKL